MSYYANGAGTVQFRTVLSDDEKRKVKSVLSYAFECRIWDSHGAQTTAEFYRDGKYNDEDVLEALGEVAKIAEVESGSIYYDGEDGTSWRIVYKDGNWLEETAEKVYCEDDMVRELKSRGYKILRPGEKPDVTDALRAFLEAEMRFRLESIHEVDNVSDELVDKCVKHFLNDSALMFNYAQMDEEIAGIVGKEKEGESYYGA